MFVRLGCFRRPTARGGEMTQHDTSPSRRTSCERLLPGCAPMLGVVVWIVSTASQGRRCAMVDSNRQNNFESLRCSRSPHDGRATNSTRTSVVIPRVGGCSVLDVGGIPLRIAKPQKLKLRNSGLVVIERTRSWKLEFALGLG